MNGKDTFNIDSIKEALENNFKSSYSIIKNRKESQLLKDFIIKLIPPKNSLYINKRIFFTKEE